VVSDKIRSNVISVNIMVISKSYWR